MLHSIIGFFRQMRRVFIFLFVLALGINCFAAVVSDNDGSAFITKAEFDSLKNEFQNQINNYNNAIDNKIDGAINSYLTGIRASTTITLDNIVKDYASIYWLHDFSIEAKERKMTSRYVIEDVKTGTVQPNYVNETGWSWYRYNRGLKVTFYSLGNFVGLLCGTNLDFPSDGAYTKTCYSSGNNPELDNRHFPIFMVSTDSKGVLRNNPLVSFWNVFYHCIGFGADHGGASWVNAENQPGMFQPYTFYPIEPATVDSYLTFKITNKNPFISNTHRNRNSRAY